MNIKIANDYEQICNWFEGKLDNGYRIGLTLSFNLTGLINFKSPNRLQTIETKLVKLFERLDKLYFFENLKKPGITLRNQYLKSFVERKDAKPNGIGYAGVGVIHRNDSLDRWHCHFLIRGAAYSTFDNSSSNIIESEWKKLVPSGSAKLCLSSESRSGEKEPVALVNGKQYFADENIKICDAGWIRYILRDLEGNDRPVNEKLKKIEVIYVGIPLAGEGLM